MFPHLIKAKNLFLDILFPPICLSCQKHTENRNLPVCGDCFKSIKINNTLFCPVCRARLPDGKKICHYDSPYLLAAAASYDNPAVQNLIHCFKYKGFENLSVSLSEIATEYLGDLIRNLKLEIRNFVIVPIPLYFWRERERGFNQAKLISENLSLALKLTLVDGLKRTKKTEPQAKSKNAEERAKNISGCFAAKNPSEIAGKNILLVDDVFTSGATMNEAVKTLKSAGAGKIIALTLAKV